MEYLTSVVSAHDLVLILSRLNENIVWEIERLVKVKDGICYTFAS